MWNGRGLGAMQHVGEVTPDATPPAGDAGQEFFPAAQVIRPIGYRAARVGDSVEIVRYICKAGGGLYEFLFDDLIPFVTAAGILAAGVAGEEYPISYRNCFIAFDTADNRVLGAANAFPADALGSESYQLVPRERQEHIRAMLELQDRGSLFLNALAVDDDSGHRGIGTKLLHWAQSRARAARLPRLSLHVWADNANARRFYQKHGFVELAVANVAPHSRLGHCGGSILMSAPVNDAVRDEEWHPLGSSGLDPLDTD